MNAASGGDNGARRDAKRRRRPHQADATPPSSSRLTKLPSGAAPSRQIRRVGVKIGKKVLEFQRPLFRLGPLRVYRTASGRLVFQWMRRKR